MKHRRPWPKVLYMLAIAIAMASMFTLPLHAQSNLATLSGTVTDPHGAVVPEVKITLTRVGTNAPRNARTNRDGYFIIHQLEPGKYTLHAIHQDFAIIEMSEIVLNTADRKELQIRLSVGAKSETITVTTTASGVELGGSVGTIVDQQFVANLPLNGRSFQNLLLATPGITQGVGDGGLSVNGLRTDANYFTVDGVSANAGTYRADIGAAKSMGAYDQEYQYLSGATPTVNAIGGLQGVLSLDALEEFKVQASTYSAQYGRQPGAQVQLTSKSGTNVFHGSIYDYARNDIFNARWTNFYSPFPEKQRERQHDFGATLGGPIVKDRAFFFFNYEGVRATLPNINSQSYSLPALWLRNDQNIPKPLRDMMNMFPTNMGPEVRGCSTATVTVNGKLVCPTAENVAGGTALEFPMGYGMWTGAGFTYRNTDNYRGRVDYMVNAKLTAFFTANISNSSAIAFPMVYTSQNDIKTKMFTFGTGQLLARTVANDIRVSYSRNSGTMRNQPKVMPGLGGVMPEDLSAFAPPYKGSQILWSFLGGSSYYSGNSVNDLQRQWNFIDNLSWTQGKHSFTAGADFRYTYPHIQPMPYRMTVSFNYPWSMDPSLLNTEPYNGMKNGVKITRSWLESITAATGWMNYPASPLITQATADMLYLQQKDSMTLIYKNLSLFVQDSWKLAERLTLDLGVRWEYNPPVSARGGKLYYVTGWENWADMKLENTDPYRTVYRNFAPRVGFAYALRNQPGRETVLRGGTGIFYDLGSQTSGGAAGAYPHSTSLRWMSSTNDKSNTMRAYPFSETAMTIPPPVEPSASPTSNYASTIFHGAMKDFVLPRTYQWNFAVQQALGGSQSVTVTYVGNAGRRLIRRIQTTRPPGSTATAPGFSNNSNIYLSRNDGDWADSSDYNALQVQYQRRMSKGLQILANYTWSHAQDTNSYDFYPVNAGGGTGFNQSSGATGGNSLLTMPVFTRGDSDNDRRQVFNTTLEYDLPKVRSLGRTPHPIAALVKAIVNNWSTDTLFRWQSGQPFSVYYSRVMTPYMSGTSQFRASRVPGQPVWIENPAANGGRFLNMAAFAVPACGLGLPQNACNGNTPRNGFRGPSAWGHDLTMRRMFPVRENVKLEMRADFYNVFNHPNWGNPVGNIGQVDQNGVYTPTPTVSIVNGALSNAVLGMGSALGLPATYQFGGPRSMQLALKLSF